MIVYSGNSCAYCKQLKEYLNERGIAFEEKNVSEDLAARRELMAAGFMGVPVLKVNDEYIQGFNRELLDSKL